MTREKIIEKERTNTISKASSIPYELPPQPVTRDINLPTIFNAIDDIVKLENVYYEFQRSYRKSGLYLPPNYQPESVAIGVLRYLGKEYPKTFLKQLLATHVDIVFVEYMHKFEKRLVDRINNYIGDNKKDVKDDCNGLNDIAHLAFSTLMKLVWSPTPAYWASWGGDLATGMADLHYYNTKYSRLDLQALSDSIIGAYPRRRSDFLIKNKVIFNEVNCNFTDMCDNADSIALANIIKPNLDSVHAISRAMDKYYYRLDMRYRFEQYKYDGFEIDRPRAMKEMLIGKVADNHIDFSAFDHLKENATTYEKECACDSFALYIYKMCK